MTMGNCDCGENLASTWSRVRGDTVKIPDVLYCRKCNKFFKYTVTEIKIDVDQKGDEQ